MSELEIVNFNQKEHLEILTELGLENAYWIQETVQKEYNVDLIGEMGSTIEEYVRDYITTEISSPNFHFFLVKHTKDNAFIGTGGLKRHSETVAEIKRMYLKEKYRGRGFGLAFVRFILKTAKSMEFDIIRLDTLLFMTQAQRIYEHFGFLEIEPYEKSEVPPKLSRLMKYYELKIE